MSLPTLLQPLSDGFKAVHRHPRTVRAAAAGGAFSGCGRFQQLFVRYCLLHFVKNTPIGSDNKLLMWQRFSCINELAGGTDSISHIHYRLR
ncbi:hypothetical protein SDC9_199612 [bioreactor metagenome]|uniref:Uncharacterized protein n=1 Tax=bioreactor metagenome TaxID=1076179 RepID=A0A645ILI1_9ZZZZ